jgi:glycosyltransferase involved in cell wall biosynthesis
MSIYVFTSAAVNYIPKVMVLAKTVKQQHPDIRFSFLIPEALPSEICLDENYIDEVVTVEELGISDLNSWLFEHTLVEASTAIKAFYLCRLLERPDCEAVVYLDPDIAVFSSMQSVLSGLASCSVMLTPHLLRHEHSLDAVLDNEMSALKHGTYNLGFVGVNKCAEGMRFALWWRERLRLFCHDDIANGLFVDQRWADLVPALFEDVRILRDYGANVATWNLTHRSVEGDFDKGFTVNGSPLVFFHFSGLDSGKQLLMLNKYGRDMPALLLLRDWYLEQCRQEGDHRFAPISWSYSCFSNGVPITAEHRRLYRETPELRARFPDPFNAQEVDRSFYHYLLAEHCSDARIPALAMHSSPAWVGEASHAQNASPIVQFGVALTPSLKTIEKPWFDNAGHFPIFDPEFYLETYPDVAEKRLDPVFHYEHFGAQELKNPGPLFDAEWYVKGNCDPEAKENPLRHFLYRGWKEHKNPHPLFDVSFYLERNEDVREANINPLSHFIVDGWSQMRDPHVLFDVSYYLQQNADVAYAGINPLAHFLARGAWEQRNPHPLFDIAFYLHQNLDVAQSGVNPLLHFILKGSREGRSPHPLFDSRFYLDQFPPEQVQPIENPLVHYLSASGAEFDPHPLFNTSFYLQRNPDVLKSGVNALLHFLEDGARQGRRPNPNFDIAAYSARHPEIAESKINPLVHFLQSRPQSAELIFAVELAENAGVTAASAHEARIDRLRRWAGNAQSAIVFLNQADGGGTRRHVRDLCQLASDDCLVLLLKPSLCGTPGVVELSAPQLESELCIQFDQVAQFDQLTNLLKGLCVERVHVHHVQQNESFARNLIEALNVPFDFTVHDYYVLSPQLHLVDENGRFAGEPDGRYAEWRARLSWLIEDADRVIAPSIDVKQRLKHFYPCKEVVAAYHPGSSDTERQPRVQSLREEEFLKILILGELGNHKGAAILDSCAVTARRRRLPLSFELLGTSTLPLTTYPQTELTVHGAYRDEQLQELIGRIAPHLCWFPARCPETYSYTLTAALQADLPVVATNIGAFPERLAGRKWSFIAPWDSDADEWLNLFVRIRNQYFLNGIDPPSFVSGGDRAAYDFYEKEYLKWRTNGNEFAAVTGDLRHGLVTGVKL